MEKKLKMSELYIFDFDDTLAMTDSHVRVIRNDGTVDRLDSRQFAKYRYSYGDQLDFSEFSRASGTLINDTVEMMESAISESGLSNVFIVTARAEPEPVRKFLESLNVTTPEIVATSGSEGKATWLTRKLETTDYNSVVVYEDCRKNITMLKDIVEAYNEETDKNIEYKATCILPDGRQEIVEKLLRELIKINLYT